MSTAIRWIGYAFDIVLIGYGWSILTGPPSAAANFPTFAGCVILGAILAIACHLVAGFQDR